MPIPTEPIGSIPRPLKLLEAIRELGSTHPSLKPLFEGAIRDTIRRFEDTGSPVITDGEQRKYVALAGEPNRVRVLEIIKKYLKPGQRVFVGVVSPIDPRVEDPKEIRDRILEAARYIPVDQLGTTDDCGFSPFCDDTSTTRDTAFAKVRARVEGTALATTVINGG